MVLPRLAEVVVVDMLLQKMMMERRSVHNRFDICCTRFWGVFLCILLCTLLGADRFRDIRSCDCDSFGNCFRGSCFAPDELASVGVVAFGRIDSLMQQPVEPSVEPFVEPFVEVPDIEVPDVEILAVEVPDIEVPAVEVPGIEVPAVEAPDIDVPAVEVPDVEAPDFEIPVEIPEQASD